MNLNTKPTIEQLRDLIMQCDDLAGHHVLWVKGTGDVELSTMPRDQTPIGFEKAHPDMKLRFETFEAGNEYVGPDAADDQEWISRAFASILKEWPKVNVKNGVAYVDCLTD